MAWSCSGGSACTSSGGSRTVGCRSSSTDVPARRPAARCTSAGSRAASSPARSSCSRRGCAMASTCGSSPRRRARRTWRSRSTNCVGGARAWTRHATPTGRSARSASRPGCLPREVPSWWSRTPRAPCSGRWPRRSSRAATWCSVGCRLSRASRTCASSRSWSRWGPRSSAVQAVFAWRAGSPRAIRPRRSTAPARSIAATARMAHSPSWLRRRWPPLRRESRASARFAPRRAIASRPCKRD